MAESKSKEEPIQTQTKISTNVTVVEKELKNDAVHTDQITGI